MFDEKNIALKLAVISDIHFLYTYQSGKEVAENLKKYAKAVATLHSVSGGGLDAVMMCGDYCSLGCMEQARVVAQSTKVIFESIFKDNMPKLLIGMGNHDTCWRNEKYECMNAKEWYELFDAYGLDDGFSEDSDKKLGNIHIEASKNGVDCHLLYVETEDYAENIFKPETLEWLDKMLSEITSKNPNSYVLVGTHGPVAESGTYGTDENLEAGAVWATAKNNIDKVLSKYPQIILFTGHTHYSPELETAIMQKNYTAVNVPPVFARDYYNSMFSKFLDGQYPDNQYGIGIYIEVDNCGRLRMKKINFLGEESIDMEYFPIETVKNPAYGFYEGEPETFDTVLLKSCRIVKEAPVTFCGEDWLLNAPDKEKNHLKKYSPARGNVPCPQFKKPDEISAKLTRKNNLHIKFPAAVSERIILHYTVRINKSSGEKYDEYKILGNWCDIKNGVAEGTSHKDAAYFEYDVPVPDFEFTAELTAVDEYGNYSEKIKLFSNTKD